jgi:hypothetical protein
MAETLWTVYTGGRRLLRKWWWLVGPKLVFYLMTARVPEIMDGSLYKIVIRICAVGRAYLFLRDGTTYEPAWWWCHVPIPPIEVQSCSGDCNHQHCCSWPMSEGCNFRSPLLAPQVAQFHFLWQTYGLGFVTSVSKLRFKGTIMSLPEAFVVHVFLPIPVVKGKQSFLRLILKLFLSSR